MDPLTLILIAVGALAVLALVVLGFLEVKRNAAAKREASAPGPRKPVEASPVKETVATPKPGAAASRVSETARPAPRVEPPAAAPAPAAPVAKPAASVASLTAGQRSALARLTIMAASFDREIAISVADCDPGDIDALLESGLLVADESGSRLDLTAAARGGASGALAPDEARMARVRHAEYFITLGEAAIAARTSDKVKAPGGVDAPAVVVFQEERPHFEAAFAFLGSGNDLASRLFRLVDAVGWGHAIQLEPADGVRWAEAALTAARIMKDRAAERDALGHLGGAHTDAGAHAEALACYEQAAAISRELEDRHNEGRFVGNAGLARHRMGEPEKAVEAYETVLTIMRELGDRPREGIALASLGQAVADMGDHAKAIGYFEQFLEITIEAGDRRASAMALAHLGTSHTAIGDHAKAAEFHERQLRATQQFRDLPGESHALGTLGEACLALGNLDRAIECFTRQVEVAHMLMDAHAGARAMGNLGLSHLAAHRASKALECFEEQLKIARKVGDREAEAKALWNAAKVVRSRGQLADAVTRASAAVPIFDEIQSSEAAALRAEIAEWRAQGG